MECGGRGEGGGCQDTGRWLHRGETYSVPAGGSHHGPVQTSQCYCLVLCKHHITTSMHTHYILHMFLDSIWYLYSIYRT